MSKNSCYSRYTTDFKIAVKLGIADPSHVKDLPRSTRYNFRNASYEDLLGREYEGLIDRISQVKEILDSRTATAVALSLARFVFFVKKLGKNVTSLSREKKPAIRRQFVKLVQKAEAYIPRKKILEYFEMSPRRFRNWENNPDGCTRAPHFESVAQYPHQLTNEEIQKIIRAYRDPDKASWSSFAIASDLFRQGIVVAGTSTIMDYARKLGLHKRKLRKKRQKRGSVEAHGADDVWHMDVTRIASADNIIHYLHLVMDNFSRKILGWHLSAELRAVNSRRVIQKAIEGMKKDKGESVNLVSDGGSENDNYTVRDFLETTDVVLLIAQRDVHYSNSMVEAVNRTLKYRHIFPHIVPEALRLNEFIERAVTEYNNRPHSNLKGLTPHEKYDGQVWDQEHLARLRKEARIKRMDYNRTACPPLEHVEYKNERTNFMILLLPEKYSQLRDKHGNIVSVSCIGCAKCRGRKIE